MSTPQPDLAHRFADLLLSHITQRLTELDAKPGRSFVCGEDSIPSDDCCKGLVWTRVASIFPTDGSGAPHAQLNPAVTPVPGHVILLEAGALRCAPTVDSRGRPPSPEKYTESALTSSQDRDAIRRALECDLPADLIAENADGQIVGPWTPVYNGECAGGFITTQIVTTIVF